MHTTSTERYRPSVTPSVSTRPGIRARAAVVAEFRSGRTALTTLRSEPPLTLRPTADALYVIGTAAGPLGGDELTFDIAVGDGATLTLRTVAASIVLPGPGGGRSSTVTNVVVGRGATLVYEPEPVIAVAGCDHVATTIIQLAADATLVWNEHLVLGRHGEESGSILQRLRVDRAGAPLYRNDLAFGPVHPGWDTPAGIGEARRVDTTLTVGAAAPVRPSATVMPLAPDATLTLTLR